MHRRRIGRKRRQRSTSWGMELIQFHAALAISRQDDLQKRMNRITYTWRMDDLEKWMIIWFTPHQTDPSKMDVLPKTGLPNIIAAKWLERHSSTSPKQQRRSLPSLLFDSSSKVLCQVRDDPDAGDAGRSPLGPLRRGDPPSHLYTLGK